MELLRGLKSRHSTQYRAWLPRLYGLIFLPHMKTLFTSVGHLCAQVHLPTCSLPHRKALITQMLATILCIS